MEDAVEEHRAARSLPNLWALALAPPSAEMGTGMDTNDASLPPQTQGGNTESDERAAGVDDREKLAAMQVARKEDGRMGMGIEGVDQARMSWPLESEEKDKDEEGRPSMPRTHRDAKRARLSPERPTLTSTAIRRWARSRTNRGMSSRTARTSLCPPPATTRLPDPSRRRRPLSLRQGRARTPLCYW